MSDPFIGQIVMFGGNFAPRNWAFCDGQLLPIAQNTTLFPLLGTIYGGDGRTTFGLPDLRGRVPMHWGAGPGRVSRTIGESGGNESHSQVIAHSHGVTPLAARGEGQTAAPAGAYPAAGEEPTKPYHTGQDTSMAPLVTSTTGNPAVDHMPPFQCVSFIIALIGIFPSRN